MTHEEAKAWLTAHNVFPRVTPVAEPGVWHLRKEDDGYAEFVNRRTGEVLIFGAPIPASKCTSRPDCSCDFCIQTRAQLSEGTSERNTRDRLAQDFIDSYLRERR